MGTVRHVSSLRALRVALKADGVRIGKKAQRAVERTADAGRLVVYANAPVAFGEVREGLIDEKTSAGARIAATAPHSAAVETGSRPHFPPLEPLIAWVKLRGMQGLEVAAQGRIPKGHQANVLEALGAQGSARSSPIDAPRRVAYAIALAISKSGTKPTWFMRGSLPEIRSLLDAFMTSGLKHGD